MRLSHFCFYLSTASTFAALWTMQMHIAPRDGFSWALVIFSFSLMAISAIYSAPSKART